MSNIEKKENEPIDALEFDAETIEEIDSLKQYNKPMIIVFEADYCPTCRNYMPTLDNIYEKYKDYLIIKRIDTVKHNAIRKLYNIELIPSTLIFNADGTPYKPSENISMKGTASTVKERKYVSDNISIVSGNDLGLNTAFEYGMDENKNLVYTKYIGYLTLTQIEEIVGELLEYKN